MDTVSISANRPKLWEKRLFQDVMRGIYFQERGMMGTGENNIIQIKTGLMKSPGDTYNLPLTARLTGRPVTGDSELEGNEQEISSYNEQVAIDQARFAASTTGKLDEQINAYDMRMDIKDKLQIQITEFLERQFFLKLGGVANTSLTDTNGVQVALDAAWSNTPDVASNTDTGNGYGARYLCANYEDGADGLTSTHLITPDLITDLKVKAKLASPKIVPLRIDGQDHYVLFVHPWQAADLKQNATFNQARREAEVRGKDNPIFTGALGVWDGVIIIEHEFVPYLDIDVAGHNFGSSNSGTDYSADCARAILCGRQAAVFAQCVNPNGWVEEQKDYKNKLGIATGLIGGIQKVQFNSVDYGVAFLDTAVRPRN